MSLPPGPVRIALLGAGGFATDAHLPAILHNADTIQLVAVYSRSLASCTALGDSARSRFGPTRRLPALDPAADYYADDHPQPGHDLAGLLARSDVDAVALCLPIPHQPQVLLACLAAGKHVLSEKPLAPSLHLARQLLNEYETKYLPRGLQWLVAEQFPHAPAWEKARQLVQDAKLGRLIGFDAHVFIQPSLKAGATNWRRVPEYQGGFLLDGGVHFFAALRHVLSGSTSPATSRPTEITALAAQVTQLNPELPPADTLRCLISTSDPTLSGTLTLSFGTPSPAETKLYTFYGTHGVLTVDLGVSAPRTVLLTLVSQTSPSESPPLPPSSRRGSGPHQGSPPRPETPLPPRRIEIELPAQTAVEAEYAAFARLIRPAAAADGGAGSDAPNGVGDAAGRAAMLRSGPRAALRDLACVEGALQSGERGGEKVDLQEMVGSLWWEIK